MEQASSRFSTPREVCRKVIQACANGGAKCIEFTNRGDFAAHVFYEVTRHFAEADPSVIMGVGSIVDAPTAGIYMANGARFVVGPVLNPDVAKVQPRQDSAPVGTGQRNRFAEELGCEMSRCSRAVRSFRFRQEPGPSPGHGSRPPAASSRRRVVARFGAGSIAAARQQLITALLDANDYAESSVAETVHDQEDSRRAGREEVTTTEEPCLNSKIAAAVRDCSLAK
jgi:2-dehydro-3-deoxyphosphogluconate aldolase/(4S)-4-hydroxy-2-oxoglutarate aldolase